MMRRTPNATGLLTAVMLAAMSVSPARAIDTDLDGMEDLYELVNGFDHLDPDENANGFIDGRDDSDGDGLGNLFEQRVGTHPRNPDTDGDGVSDGAEMASTGFVHRGEIAAEFDGNLSFQVADPNGDGFDDVVVASDKVDLPNPTGGFTRRLSWFAGGPTGLGGENLIRSFSFAGNYDQLRCIIDINGDGDLDLLTYEILLAGIGHWDLHANTDGAGTFASAVQIFIDFPDCPGDIDGDGLPDVVTSLSTGPDSFRVAWRRNINGQGGFGSPTAVGPEWFGDVSGGPTHVGSNLVADFDNDGDADFGACLTDITGLCIVGPWFENTDGAGTFVVQGIGTPGTSTWEAAADLDGDGDRDVTSLGNGSFGWFEYVAPPGDFTAVHPQSSATIVDWDGDGDFDLLRPATWEENVDGRGTFVSSPLASFAALQGDEQLAAHGDFDGDGDLDALVWTFGYPTFPSPQDDSSLGWYENVNVSDPIVASAAPVPSPASSWGGAVGTSLALLAAAIATLRRRAA